MMGGAMQIALLIVDFSIFNEVLEFKTEDVLLEPFHYFLQQ